MTWLFIKLAMYLVFMLSERYETVDEYDYDAQIEKDLEPIGICIGFFIIIFLHFLFKILLG